MAFTGFSKVPAKIVFAMSVCLSVCVFFLFLFVCLYVCLSVCVSVCLYGAAVVGSTWQFSPVRAVVSVVIVAVVICTCRFDNSMHGVCCILASICQQRCCFLSECLSVCLSVSLSNATVVGLT